MWNKRALLLSFFIFGACAKEPPKPGQKGRGFFIALGCRACHKIGQEGGAGGPDLTFIGLRKSPQWLDLWLKDPQAWKKNTLMPNPHISEEARKEIVEYLGTLKGQDFGAQHPWSGESDPVKKGHLIFTRAGCVACHGMAGAGGYPNNNVPGGLIPALNRVAQTYSKAELAAKIKRGVKPQKIDPAGPDPMIAMPAWGEVLTEAEIEAVAAYLFSLGGASPSANDW